MRRMTLTTLRELDEIDEVIVDSLEQALYRMTLIVAGYEHYLVKDGQPYCTRNIAELQKHLVGKKIGRMMLRHRSPYDEMIGLGNDRARNELLVPLGMPADLIH
jgi:hypothetical protein